MSKEITNVSISVLKEHPRNTEFFDNISGKELQELRKQIIDTNYDYKSEIQKQLEILDMK